MTKQIMRPKMSLKVIDDFVERSFIKLKQLYPDRRIVELEQKDKELHWQLNRLTRRLGYAELADLLRQCGFDVPSENQKHNVMPEKIAEPENLIISDTLQSALDKLEQLYPEHKIFALDALDKDLQDKLNKLAHKAGLPSTRDLLQPYGYEFIAGNAVKELRSSVIYPPGNEPEIIKNKVQNMLNRLESYYPEHIIYRMIEADHKNLAQNVSALYRWLGYADTKAMLAAYGFDYQKNETGSGRPATEFQPILDALQAKYQNQPKPTSLGVLLFENPEYKGNLKTMQNRAQEFFGTSLLKYLRQLGIMDSAVKKIEKNEKNEKSKPQVLQILAERYAQPEAAAYGSYEQAVQDLAAFEVQRNRNGWLCITGPAEADEPWNCGSELQIPYGIDSIGVEAFQGRPELQRVSLPAGLQQIGYRAFAACPNLKEVLLDGQPLELADYKLNIEAAAFWGSPYGQAQSADKQTTPPEDFTYSFNAKHQVTITGYTGSGGKVIIPSQIEGCSVTAIAKGAFQDNKYLTEVVVPDSVITIQGQAFKNCISLSDVHLSNNLHKIVTTTFNGCIGLKNINIPDSVVELKDNTFHDSPLSTLHIGKGLASVNTEAFYNGEYNFDGQFTGNRTIWNVSIDPENPNLKADGSCILSADGRQFLAALGALSSYVVPEGVETIAKGAFANLRSLTDIILPTSLREIGSHAFASTNLRSVSFEENLKKIGDYAFSYCKKLTSAIFAEGLQEIGRHAFVNCPIESVWLPASLQRLGSSSFDCLSNYYSEKKQNFYISPNNPTMKADGSAFYTLADDGWRLQKAYGDDFFSYNNLGQNGNASYTVAPQTTAIAAGAFQGCQNLAQIILPDSLQIIEEEAFYNCENLKSIKLPAGLTKIGYKAFNGTNITSFELHAGLTEIGAGAFITGSEWNSQNTAPRSIQVDSENPWFYVDMSCKSLLRRLEGGGSLLHTYFGNDDLVNLPEAVTEIAPLAFCDSIVQEVHLPASIVAIGENAFQNCFQLKRLCVHFAQPENDVSHAVIYIPAQNVDNDDEDYDYDYGFQSLRNQYLDCIRVKDGSVFDFVKYDSLFAGINDQKDKILVAADRLKSSIKLVPLYRNAYLTYLRTHAEYAIEVVVEFDDLAGLNMLAELGVFTGQNIDGIIELANQSRQTDILSYLLNYKNSQLGISDTTGDDYEL